MIVFEIILICVIGVIFKKIIGGTISRMNNWIVKLIGIETSSANETKLYIFEEATQIGVKTKLSICDIYLDTFYDSKIDSEIIGNGNHMEVISRHQYFAFGMKMDGLWSNKSNKPVSYTYNGKEHISDPAIDLHDYGARFYDPAVGRFLSVDRFAEKFPWQSSYSYASNNPISFIDINGDSTRVYNTGGEYQMTINDNLPNQDHFFTNSQLEDFCNTECSSDNETGDFFRQRSKYFIGENTRSQIQNISIKSDKEGLERAIAFEIGVNRELQAIDITSYAGRRGSNSIGLYDALKNYGGNPIFGGHTHPQGRGGHNDVRNPSQPRSLNNMVDLQGFVRNRYTGNIGGNPAIIGSHKGITIYNTGTRVHGMGSTLHSFGVYSEIIIGY